MLRIIKKSGVMIWILAILLISFFGVISFLASAIYEFEDSVDGVRLPAVDVIVCLAGGRGRISAAADIWYRYHSQHSTQNLPTLYFSGVGHQANWSVLTKQVRRGVLEVLRPKDVILETQSSNTVENAEFLKKFARERNWKKILLITSSYHMRRSQLIFDRVLADLNPPVRVETLSVYQEPFDFGEWNNSLHGIRVTLEEYIKWVYYRTSLGLYKNNASGSDFNH